MSSRSDEEYELGRNVTHLAQAGSRKETAVLSIRVPSTEIARLERMGRETGKSVSQIVRDAIASYSVRSPSLIIGHWSGSTSINGETENSRTVHWEVVPSDTGANATGTAVPMQLTLGS